MIKPKSVRPKQKTEKLNPTRNDLPESVRLKATTHLNVVLADIIDLQLQIKEAHWNLKGPNFIGIHLWLDTVEEEIEEYVDMVAERAVQLGGRAEGTVQRVAAKTRLPEYPLDLHTIPDHMTELANAFGFFAKNVRKGIDEADDFGDADTADLYTEVSRWVDKTLWFIEAHLL